MTPMKHTKASNNRAVDCHLSILSKKETISTNKHSSKYIIYFIYFDIQTSFYRATHYLQ